MSTALSDTSDNFPICEGTLLASCYEVQAFLGEGSFGKVARCVDIVTNTKMAVKITKDNPYLTERALEELSTALLHLKALEIMHADLKPENIMVVDRRQEPLQVKIIDFGLALHVSNAVQGSCVQSLWYRAPEVMLGLAFMEPIDMWSLGLVAAEIALGFPLFPGNHEYDMRMCFSNKADQNELQNCVDLLKKMLLIDKNERIIPLKVLEHPFFFVEQHTHSSQNMNNINLTVDMEEAETKDSQEPPSQETSVHGSALCDVASQSMTLHIQKISLQCSSLVSHMFKAITKPEFVALIKPTTYIFVVFRDHSEDQ
ncbi:hypothetical protein PAMP_020587 [Pampus punctatissimus]